MRHKYIAILRAIFEKFIEFITLCVAHLKSQCYLDCVCGIQLFSNISVSQPQTQGDHPSSLF